MAYIKLIVCGYSRQYAVNDVNWDDLPTVSQSMVDKLEAHLGKFSRDTNHDREKQLPTCLGCRKKQTNTPWSTHWGK
jgi:hypothetical protein